MDMKHDTKVNHGMAPWSEKVAIAPLQSVTRKMINIRQEFRGGICTLHKDIDKQINGMALIANFQITF